jgi:tRNA G18 (ribose-2'-O)-methylase SpoU
MHITSGQNPQIKNSVRLRESAQERRAQGLFFLEGFRLCADALASGYAPEKIFLTEAARVKYNTQALENAAAAVFYINDAAAQKLASTQNPQGVFGTFKSLNAQPHAQPMPEHKSDTLLFEATCLGTSLSIRLPLKLFSEFD